ncbi:MAG: signal peptidase I [Hominimerdicola sp.]
MDDNKKIGNVSEEDIELAKSAEPDDLKEKKPVSLVDEILEWAESFVFAMFVIVLLFTFFFRIVLVDGPSMNNTLIDGDRLIISHINYTPERGDIVVVNSYEINKTIIKRCIGVAGDTVRIDYNSNTVTVNGEKISNDTNKETMIDTGLFDTDYMVEDGVYEYVVPEGTIFVLGDNRNHSTDSRAKVSFVKLENILGHAVFRLYPFESFGKIE